ncbi:2Fe-2S iron-sulfur cluster-binding protein [Marinobacter alexandrii]|uniref:2Fe-2S iron-sulfur cluster-binding protein n=1 Tax=Marinobacter alexandrii TaxID=2570351 RepID=UPI001FFFBF1F|nr:2Fe-2S iron-sulfur cluster-binding protein [Marinobacter alexandrii]
MAEGFQITNRTSGDSFACDEGQSVLKAMEQRALKCVPVGCRGGGCGFCKIRVVDGDFECGKMSRAHVSPEAIEEGEVLACRVYPLTDLIIECLPQSAAGSENRQTKTTALR